jgi:RNA polymerase sigma-70 factor (ECF subfamily)
VWDRADAYDRALGTPVAWLVRIARNRAIDRVRARAVRPAETARPLSVEHASRQPSPEQAAGTAETHRAVTGALETLPAEQRELIERAFFDGLTHTELAARTGLPLGTVKTRIRTGMQALKRRLAPLDEGR